MTIDTCGTGAADRLEISGVLLRSGQVTEALETLTGLSDLADRGPAWGEVEEALLLTGLMECRLVRGDLGEAMRLGEHLAPIAEGPGTAAALAHHSLGELDLALGEAESALAHYLAAGDLAETLEIPADVLPWRADAVVALVHTGGRDADRMAEDHLTAVRGHGSPYAVAHALRALATADAGGRRLPLLREARAALEGVVAPRLAAQIDTDIAGLLVLEPGAGTPDEAVSLLRDAERYAGAQHLWPLQGRVRRLLERVGEGPHRGQSEALAALTQAERRVSALAVEGLTNRQIAERLVVSVKAVEWHLSRVYRKLGIGSRRALAGALGSGL